MTITEFRKHKYFSSQWRKELENNGILRRVIEVLNDNHPNRRPVDTDINDDISPTKAALFLGHARGYSAVLNDMQLLAVPDRTGIDIGEPTYEPAQIEEEPHG